ncbi:peptidase [Cellulophaga phage Calle_1]|uniref:Peptidase n=1 Tax=Cellulophaga phage Calle_1 TaxID=2745643 RepID=A0A8E4ZBD0_9CAUD|nr:peptidase [Cellulophaga phage Calle_1]QQV89766.1 peptidase [Cellulophaga phage Calle_1]QQV89823.1 peptidase [Cellulophaga phage Calle_2]QQV89896.1 peptidase [Cellulophaga phage Calle_3]
MSKERLEEVMAIQSESYETQNMIDFISNEFEAISADDPDNYCIVIEDENIYITKGYADTYPCVVAHTDTVHEIQSDMTVFDDGITMFAMNMRKGLQMGIGGDDKVGIYIALEALRNNDYMKVAFFRDEEMGCLGSMDADMKFFKDVEFVLQCDRQGYKDFVTEIYGVVLLDEAFSNAVSGILEKYGKIETTKGGMTDVYQLCLNGLEVCSANISCGYYRPHCDDEVIIIEDVFRTRDLVDEIIKSLSGTVWRNSLKSKSRYPKSYREEELPEKFDNGYFNKKGNWVEFSSSKSSEKEYPSSSQEENPFNSNGEPIGLMCLCEQCDGIDLMYDANEDADWCFSCGEYTNKYNNFQER